MPRSDIDAEILEMDCAPVLADIRSRFGDRHDLSVFHRTKPDRSILPIILDEVDVTPTGGKKHNPHGPWLWCSECERPKFWHGLAITNEKGGLYLIGSECGRRHYGDDAFKAARSSWKAGLERQRAIDRHAAAVPFLNDLSDELESAVGWAGHAAIDVHRKALKAAAPDVVFRLAAKLRGDGGMLDRKEPFIDNVGRSQLRTIRLGRLKGIALIEEVGAEKLLIERGKAAVGDVLAIGDPGARPPAEVVKAIRALEEIVDVLLSTWREIARAHQFFGRDNLDRVAAFAEPMKRHYTVYAADDGLICESEGKVRRAPSFEKLNPPTLRVCGRFRNVSGF